MVTSDLNCGGYGAFASQGNEDCLSKLLHPTQVRGTQASQVFGLGNVVVKYAGPDRSRPCFKFGCEDHQAGECSASPTCFLGGISGITPEESERVTDCSRCRLIN